MLQKHLPIPDDIHPAKLMGMLFGFDPEQAIARPSPHVFLHKVLRALQLPSTTKLELIRTVLDEIGPQLTAAVESPEFVVSIETLPDQFGPAFSKIAQLLSGHQQAIGRSFEQWLFANLRVPPEVLDALLLVPTAQMAVGVGTPEGVTPPLLSLRKFCRSLIFHSPERFRDAHKRQLKTVGFVQPQAVAKSLASTQKILRPLQHLINSTRRRSAGEVFSAATEVLQAWAGAAETSIFNINRFLWWMRVFPDADAKFLPGSQGGGAPTKAYYSTIIESGVRIIRSFFRSERIYTSFEIPLRISTTPSLILKCSLLIITINIC